MPGPLIIWLPGILHCTGKHFDREPNMIFRRITQLLMPNSKNIPDPFSIICNIENGKPLTDFNVKIELEEVVERIGILLFLDKDVAKFYLSNHVSPNEYEVRGLSQISLRFLVLSTLKDPTFFLSFMKLPLSLVCFGHVMPAKSLMNILENKI